jgi:hypothetical protein
MERNTACEAAIAHLLIQFPDVYISVHICTYLTNTALFSRQPSVASLYNVNKRTAYCSDKCLGLYTGLSATVNKGFGHITQSLQANV